MLTIGLGYDIHPLTRAGTLILAGVAVEGRCGPEREGADDDVVSHAVIDALCGALRPAIGVRSIDDYFHQADDPHGGIEFLARFQPQLAKSSLDVLSLDCVITLRDGPIAPVASAMATALAKALAVNHRRVGVKAKTGNGCDDAGRGRAVAAEVVILANLA